MDYTNGNYCDSRGIVSLVLAFDKLKIGKIA
jgi:hypothetical protein